MWLINCKDCNNQVSDQASSCPSCGCLIKVKRQRLEKVPDTVWNNFKSKDFVDSVLIEVPKYYLQCVRCKAHYLVTDCPNCSRGRFRLSIFHFHKHNYYAQCCGCGVKYYSFTCPECDCENVYTYDNFKALKKDKY